MKTMLRAAVVTAALSTAAIGASAQKQSSSSDFTSALIRLGSPPLGPLIPRSRADCQEFQEAYDLYNKQRDDVHNACLTDQTAQGRKPDFTATDGCEFVMCSQWHGRAGGDEIRKCFADVSRYEQEQQETERQQKQQQEHDDSSSTRRTPPAKESPSRPVADGDAERDKVTPAAPFERRGKPEPTVGKNSGDSVRDSRDRQEEIQRKADERRIALATHASWIEQQKLDERTAEREAHKDQIRERAADADSRYAGETMQLGERQQSLFARLSDATRVSHDLGSTGGAGRGSSSSDFDFSDVERVASVATEVVGSLKDVYERTAGANALFALDRGPLGNSEREQAKRWSEGLVVIPPPNLDSPTMTPPEWLRRAGDAIGLAQEARETYESAAALAERLSTLKEFVTGATPSDRAKAFLETMKSAPQYLAETPWQAPLITVNYAADALRGGLDEGMSQFSHALDVFSTYGDASDVGDYNAVLRSMFRKMPGVGLFVRGSELIDRKLERYR